MRLYSLAVFIASLFNTKAKLFVHGRRNVFSDLGKWRKQRPGELIWFHCASLGEFEQGRPIIEKWKKQYPDHVLCISFFSPSGYEVRKNYSGADGIFYLPVDTPSNARKWLDILQPHQVVFVKYEIWSNYFLELKNRGIRLFIISVIFRPNQRFFGVWKEYWKKVLNAVHHFYVQDRRTADLLSSIGFDNTSVAGDTRFDRVVEIASDFKEVPGIRIWINGRTTIIAGSSYLAEEWALEGVLAHAEICALIVPHNITEAHCASLKAKWGDDLVRYSELNETSKGRVLLIDNVGMLSRLYAYAQIAVIGGGFGKGIHNTLEAAVYGIPVLFGPKYQKFIEAHGLIASGGAIAVSDEGQLLEEILVLLKNELQRARMAEKAGQFVRQNTGATALIMRGLEANR